MSIPEAVHRFKDIFYETVKQIPAGRVTTYGTLAQALGDKIASRAVGKMLNENPRPIEVPCHRVVMSNGDIGGFGLGVEKKKELLRKEDIKIENDRILDFKDIIFKDFKTEPVLTRLRTEQDIASKKVQLVEDSLIPDIVGGVDVSYSGDKAYGSLSLWNGDEEISNIVVEEEISFPYIPTYLAYRELPVLMKLVERSDMTPDVILVDGNGILHPNRIGLASHLGVEVGIPTVGVAKNKLLGRLDGEVTHEEPVKQVLYNDKMLGYAYLSSSRAKNPIYVSPGHKISFEASLDIVKKYSEYKIPHPIRNAHITATNRRKSHG